MPSPERFEEEAKKLLALLRDIIPLQDVKSLLHRITKASLEVCQGDVAVLLKCDEGGKLRSLSHFPQGEEIPTFSRSTVESCLKHRSIYQVALTSDEREKFSSSIHDLHIQSALAVPLILPKSEQLYGALYVDRRKNTEPLSDVEIELVHSFTNLAAIAIENSELFQRVIVDDLTGVASRNYFLTRLEEEFSRSRRTGAPISLLLMDIDGFKEINDTYGHSLGDEILKVFTVVILRELRKYDVLGRLGGDEFGLLLPETELSQLYKVAERLQQSLKRQSWPKQLTVTSSMGGTTFPTIQATTTQDMVNQADEALYQAKYSGRSQAVIVGRQTPIFGAGLEEGYYQQNLDQMHRKLKFILQKGGNLYRSKEAQEILKKLKNLLEPFCLESPES